jgi:predicted transcriptional regulator
MSNSISKDKIWDAFLARKQVRQLLDSTIGARLAKVRKELFYSANAAAVEVGVSPSMLSHMEAGRRRIPLDVFDGLCKLYDVCPTMMLRGKEYGNE